MKRPLLPLLIGLIALPALLALAIALGGPAPIKPMPSIHAPFARVDFSALPASRTYLARDKQSLAYRPYVPARRTPLGTVVLVHGSSASSRSMHVLASALASAGYLAYALDMRGHGASGTPGQIGYIGQLEDDLEDFTHAVHLAQPAMLIGFSSGGGFALRVAGGARQSLFDSYLLLSPFISQDAPTYRPGGGGWVSIGLPRVLGLSLLNGLGVTRFNDLTACRFAVREQDLRYLTPSYSYALAQNFRPERDYAAHILAVNRPLRVIAGVADELFDTSRLAEVFRQAGKDVPVSLLPGIGHITLTLDPRAIAAIVATVQAMSEPQGAHYAQGADLGRPAVAPAALHSALQPS